MGAGKYPAEALTGLYIKEFYMDGKKERILSQARAVCRALVKAETQKDTEFFLMELGRLARRLRDLQKREGHNAQN
jgi:hypothetical protein